MCVSNPACMINVQHMLRGRKCDCKPASQTEYNALVLFMHQERHCARKGSGQDRACAPPHTCSGLARPGVLASCSDSAFLTITCVLQVNSHDKDFRYMAGNDLKALLKRPDFKVDEEIQKKLVAMVHKQLDDADGDIALMAAEK